MTAKSVKLNWEEGSVQLIDTLKKLWTDEGFTDVTLVFDDEQTIGVNSTLLAAISPIFKNVIRRRNHQNPYLFLFGVDSMSVKLLLEFIFGGEINILGFSYTHTDTKNLKDEIMEVTPAVNTEEGSVTFDEAVVANEDFYNPSEESFLNDSNEVVEESDSVENHGGVEETKILSPNVMGQRNEDTKKSKIKKSVENVPLFGHWNSKAMEVTVKEEEGILCFLCQKRDFKSLDELYDHEKIYHFSGNTGKEVKDYKCDDHKTTHKKGAH